MEKRTEKLSRILNELNIDGLFITDLYNLRYFTGFTGTTGVALATRNGNFFFSDFRYKTQATKEVSKMGFEFVEVSRESLQAVGEYIKKFGLKNVGFEDVNLSFSLYQTIKDIFKVELVPIGNKLVLERMVKSEEEKIEIQIDDENHIEDLKGIPTPIASDDIYIFDNKAEKVGKVNVTGHIYGVPVKADNINQTTMWKVLMELYKNRKEENDVYPLEQKQFCVKTLREIDSEIFEGAYRCLVSKTKKEYIDSLLEA